MTAHPSPLLVDCSVAPGRRWVDALLIVSGTAGAAIGWEFVGPAALGAAVVALMGLVSPALRWSARHRTLGSALDLVPTDLAMVHADLQRTVAEAPVALAVDAAAGLDAADGCVLEVAALLGGRPPRGAAQRRFVATRVDGVRLLVDDLDERGRAWRAAKEEVDALTPDDILLAPVPVEDDPERGGVLVTVLLVPLLPLFITADVVRASMHAAIALGDGIALRCRLAASLVLRTLASVGPAYAALRRSAGIAARDAGRLSATLHARVRLASRRAIRRARTRVVR